MKSIPNGAGVTVAPQRVLCGLVPVGTGEQPEGAGPLDGFVAAACLHAARTRLTGSSRAAMGLLS
jgi:hypothetical protein